MGAAPRPFDVRSWTITDRLCRMGRAAGKGANALLFRRWSTLLFGTRPDLDRHAKAGGRGARADGHPSEGVARGDGRERSLRSRFLRPDRLALGLDLADLKRWFRGPERLRASPGPPAC